MSISKHAAQRRLVTTMVLTAVGAVSWFGSGLAQSTREFVPVTDAMLQDPSPDDWLMWRRTLDSWGYSPLDQITRDNVDRLQMVWTRALTTGYQFKRL